MNEDQKRLKTLQEKISGELKISKSGHPYLVLSSSRLSERIRIMYFTRNHQYKLYLDKGISCTRSIGHCTTPTEVLSVIKPYR